MRNARGGNHNRKKAQRFRHPEILHHLTFRTRAPLVGHDPSLSIRVADPPAPPELGAAVEILEKSMSG